MVDNAPSAAPESRSRPGLAAGLSSFAGALLIVVGAFQALEGLSAIIKNDLLVVTQGYVYKFNVAGWGWIHLLVGLALAAVGVAILSGAIWAPPGRRPSRREQQGADERPHAFAV